MPAFKIIKIVVHAPLDAADRVRAALADSGCGQIGDYAACSFSHRGVGRFRPGDGATPAIGTIGTLESVEEESIEVHCSAENVARAIAAIHAVHPYEEPAIELIPLLDPADFTV